MPQGRSVEINATFRIDNANVLKLVRQAGERNFTSFLETFEEVAKKNSPYLTGHNRSSIKVNGHWTNPLMYEMEAFTESGYGGYLELGTSRMAPRPYFRPAFQAAVGDLERKIGEDWE